MKRSSGAGGFTIVETLIVLAVTGSLLTMAMFLIGGRQNKAQFEQGVRSFQMELQQVINDVGNGFYSSNEDINCDRNPSGGVRIIAGTNKRGTNEECLFLGKAIQFAVSPAADPEKYSIYTIAGLRNGVSGNTLNLTQAAPSVIARSNLNTFPDKFDSKMMPFGMRVVSVSYNNNAATYNPGANPLTAVAFVSSLSSLDATDKNQQVNVLAIPAVNAAASINQDNRAAATTVNASLTDAIINEGNGRKNPAGGVQICARSGSTAQSALYKIGGDGGQTTVSVTIKNSANCT